MTEDIKKEIKELFASFGTNMTFRCGLPHSAPGSAKDDGMFACHGNKCKHLPAYLQGKEMLIIDAPLKIALHISCRTALIRSLKRKGVQLYASTGYTVCFNASAAANKPSYFAMVDSIIESCFVEELQMHVIHLADFGMKAPILPGTSNCPLNILLSKMKKLSNKGVTVELIQLDFGFNVQGKKNQFIQLKCSRGPRQATGQRKKNQSLLGKSKMTVYPIHQIPSPQGTTIKSNDIEGTILLTKDIKKWNSGSQNIIIGNPDELPDDPDESWEEVCKWYKHRRNGEIEVKNLQINPNTLYSVKLYSTIAHLLLQMRSQFPLKEKALYGIGNRSIIQLQRLLRNIDYVSKEACSMAQDFGACTRIEFSIRPPHGEKLREDGHYSDFLMHVYLASYDLCTERDYIFSHKFVDCQIIRSRVLELISEAMQYLKLRTSHRFNMIYTNPRTTEWMKAHLSLLLITVGFAPAYGVKHLNKWLRDIYRFDPYRRSSTLRKSLPVSKGLENRSLPARIRKRFLHYLHYKLQFSREGVKIIHEFLHAKSSSCNTIYWYMKFPLRDKVRLSMWLIPEIIPHLSQFMSKCVTRKNKSNKWLLQNKDMKQNDLLENGNQWWLMSQPNSAKDYYEESKREIIPKDPVCRAMHLLFQMGIYFNDQRPTFIPSLCKFIVECHSNNIYLPPKGKRAGLKPLDDTPKKILKKCANGGETLTNTAVQQLCHYLSVPVTGEKRSLSYYLRAICQKYYFPCSGVKYSLKGKSKLFKELNILINNAMKSDLVVALPSTDTTKKRYYRNADNTYVIILNSNMIALSTAPQVAIVRSFETGFEMLARCLNICESPHEQNLRNFVHKRMSNLPPLQHIFLRSNGKTNRNFKGVDSLEQLEALNDFQLLMTGEITTISKSMKFIPNVIIPIAAFVYERDIAFFNMQEGKLYIHTNNRTRLVTYEFKGTNVTPTIHCLVLSLERNGSYCRNTISLFNMPVTNKARYSEISDSSRFYFSSGTFGGRLESGSNACDILPNLKTTREPFMQSLHKLMLDLNYNNWDEVYDPLGLISFVEELSSCPLPFTGFSQGIYQQCNDLKLPLRTIATILRSTEPSKLSHKIICPFFCLKYKMLLVVMDVENRVNSTFCYGYNQRLRQVECRKIKKYNVLVDRNQALYLYTSALRRGFYKPSDSHPARCKSRHFNFHTKYSHITPSFIQEILSILRKGHNINLISGSQFEEHSFRPLEDTAIMYAKVSSQNPRGIGLSELLQTGIEHNALVLVFPYRESKWETCIVHHPLQNEMDAKQVLNSLLQEIAPSSEIYNSMSLKGVQPEDCESGLYILLYALIAHKTKSREHFIHSMKMLKTEEDLYYKARTWVQRLLTNTRHQDYLPNWVEQIIMYRQSDKI